MIGHTFWTWCVGFEAHPVHQWILACAPVNMAPRPVDKSHSHDCMWTMHILSTTIFMFWDTTPNHCTERHAQWVICYIPYPCKFVPKIHVLNSCTHCSAHNGCLWDVSRRPLQNYLLIFATTYRLGVVCTVTQPRVEALLANLSSSISYALKRSSTSAYSILDYI